MNKTVVAVTLLSLLNNAAFGFMEALEPPQSDFGPRSVLRTTDQEAFGKPSQMLNILPGRPVAAKDKYGNRLYFSTEGKLILKMNTDGSSEYSAGGKSVRKDVDGNITEQSETIQGTNKVVIKNEKGQITGSQELGYGGKVIKEFDSEGNQTKSYYYDKYAKNTEFVLDELTMGRTVFDAFGRPEHDTDFEGSKIANYVYDDDSKLQYKTDVNGNKTYFNSSGQMSYTENFAGDKQFQYYYKKDDNGNTILEKSESMSNDVTYGDITYFKNGKPIYTDSGQGARVKDFNYDGTTLVYTFDHRSQETTFYDMNGKQLYNTYNDFVVKEWLYSKGRLTGFYDDRDRTVLLYQFQRDDVKIRLNDGSPKPTGEDIQKWYDEYSNPKESKLRTGLGNRGLSEHK